MTDNNNKQLHFIPAQPGYWRLELVHSRARDGVSKVYREPVIAWEMRPGPNRPNMNHFAHPVTVTWRPDRDVPILGPDGVVRLTNGRTSPARRSGLRTWRL
jgi:hypothetical protein